MKSKHHFYDTTPTIFDIVSTLFLSPHPLYWWYHTNCIYEVSSSIYVKIISIVYNNILTICTITATVPVSHTHSFHDIIPFVYMTSHPLYLIPHPLHLSSHTPSIDVFTKIMKVITLGTYMTIYPVYITSHSHFMTSILSIYDITNTAFMTSDLLYMTSHPLFRISHHFMYDIKSSVSDLASTVSASSHPLYRWHHSHYMDGIPSSISVTSYPLYLWCNIHKVWHHNSLCWWQHTRPMCDILCTADDITSSLSHQTTVFMMSHPLQAWHHRPCIRHSTHCIFVIKTSSLISHPLLNDITPTFCVTSYALYITSHPILMSSDYCTYDMKTSIYETSMKGNIYTIHETSQPLSCPHTHCIDNITPTLCMTSHSPYVWHHLYYARHHILTLWPQTTLFMSSHPLYLTSCPHYLCHHIHCIDDITPNVFWR